MTERKVYMDNSATTRMDSMVKEEMDKYFTEIYGNPGSFHSIGLDAKQAMDNARERAAKVLNAKTSEIIFTGSGTESINMAIKGLAYAVQGKKKHIITSTAEHHAVLETCEYLEKKGFDVTYLKVDRDGLIDLDELKNAIRDDTFLVSIMYANNEVGTVQDIKEIGKICSEKNVKFHTDACQASGYLDLDVKELNVDMLTLNGSKVYGPKGVGLLYLKMGTVIEPLIHGGGQENNKRSGTENVPGIMAFVKALEIAQENRVAESERLVALRNKMIREVMEKIPKVVLNGHPTKRLPNNVNLSFLDVEGEAILLYLDSKGIYASSGSACTSKTLDPSHVILAMGVPYEFAHGSIRFSLGKETTAEDVDYVIKVLPEIIQNLRNISPFNLDLENVESEQKKIREKIRIHEAKK
ncbi:MAG: cysteine desulfurase NifS [Nanoarchaeota archaeon]|nr:cysteine desulfurase NifS [Nanoarchaeota archaeon]